MKFSDIEFEVLAEFVYWLYTGRSPRIRNMALDLLVLCDRFQVTALKDVSARVLKENLRSDNVCDVSYFGLYFLILTLDFRFLQRLNSMVHLN